MKKFAVSALLVLSVSQAMAGDYFCKSAFEKKMRKIDKTAAVLGWPIGGAIFTTLAAGAAGEAVAAVVTPYTMVVITGAMGIEYFVVAPLQERTLNAEVLMAETQFSREENLFNQEDEFNQALADLRAQYENKERDPRLNYFNTYKFPTIKPYLMNFGKHEHVDLTKYDRSKGKLMTDFLVDDINKDRKDKVSFERVDALMKKLSSDDTFCPKNKAVSLKKIRKIIESKL